MFDYTFSRFGTTSVSDKRTDGQASLHSCHAIDDAFYTHREVKHSIYRVGQIK